MSWSFETDAEFQAELDWIDDFVRREVEPLEQVLDCPWDIHDPRFAKLVRPLQHQVRARKLWACHLGPELGGPGYGQMKLALINEILGRAIFGPVVFGCQAPDSGNGEILAHFGTPEQKQRFLEPLLANEIVSCFAMTEPQGGADPKVFVAQAVKVSGGWQIDGQKWFASNARFAGFFITMVVTDPDAPPHGRTSTFLVPAGTPGLTILRNARLADEKVGTHAYLQFERVFVPDDHLLGEAGQGFLVAQTRLGGGRIHHAMRTIGLARRAFEMMCERAQSRFTQGEQLARKQMVQEKIADSWMQLEQFRLLVLQTAWRIDKYHDYKKVLKDISAVKALMPKVLHDIAERALQVHGSLGACTEMPFTDMLVHSYHMGLADGPTEVHKLMVARQVLRGVAPAPDLFPSGHRPRLRQAAREQFAAALAELQAS